MTKIEQAFHLFDHYNKQDPNIFTWEGESFPQEYFLALKLYEWVLKLDPEAGEALLLASRSQHIGRWEIPRDSYSQGREAYLKWRRDLSAFHARKASELAREAGYDEETISEMEQIILKKGIKVNHDVQTIENALCLIFLQFQYEDFHPKYPAEKVINILRKSLLKMDSTGHKFALSLNYSDKGLAYIQEALKLI